MKIRHYAILLLGVAATVALYACAGFRPMPTTIEWDRYCVEESVTLSRERAVIEAVSKTVLVRSFGGSMSYAGTGAIIDGPNGLILTAHHVIANGSSLEVTTMEIDVDGRRHQTESFSAKVVSDDPVNDTAVLMVIWNVPLPKGFSLECGAKVQLHTPLLTIGRTTPVSFGEVIGSQVNRDAAGRSVVRLRSSNLVDHGDSGGPVIDRNTGRLLGIVTDRGLKNHELYFVPTYLIVKNHRLPQPSAW